MGDWSDADMQRALRESMESNSMRVGTPLSSQVPAMLETAGGKDLRFKFEIKKHIFVLVI